MKYTLSHDLNACQARVNQFIEHQFLQFSTTNTTLIDAMRYAVLLGGKRIRPFLIYATGRMLGVEANQLDHAAAAIEAIHAYSLVHDDLPAMDNDQLRRGKPTCHIAFDEATAILAGDALQSFAFELLANDPFASTEQKIAQVQLLAKAAGGNGMCLGQSLDLQAENQTVSLQTLENIHRHKTGDLIVASVLMGLNLSSFANHSDIRTHLETYAKAIGLAFQVQDDILDVIGQREKMGKTVGADEALNKSTYPKLLGLAGAQQKAQDLYQLAVHALHQLPFNSQALQELAKFIIQREN